jgi:phosphate transport system substrate-binding protein
MRYPDRSLVDSLLSERTQEILLDRQLMHEESLAFQRANLTLYTYPVAYYPVYLMVDKNNPVNLMDSTSLRGILVGRIKNWKDVGGEDHKIRVYSPLPGEGAFNAVNGFFGNLDSVVAEACTTAVQMVDRAKGDEGALLIYPLPAEELPFKRLSFRRGDKEIWPDAETIMKEPVYPFMLTLTYVTTRSKMDVAAGYLTYCVGNTGQRECMNLGYRPAAVPVKIVRVKQ